MNLTSRFVPLNFTMGGSSHKGDQLVGGLCWDRKDRLWMGGFNGLYCFDPKTQTTNRYAHATDDPMSLESNRVYQVMLDPSNVLWVGTWRGGLSKADLKKDRFGHYHHTETTPFAQGANDVIGIFEQPRGIFWIATANGGLTEVHFSSAAYRQFSNALGNKLNFMTGDITSLTGDTAGNLWVSVGNKVSQLNTRQGKFTTIAPPPIQFDYLQIQHLYHDRRGYLWMGVQDFGIVRYQPSTTSFTYFTRERNDPGAPAITGAWMFFEDRRGNLWAGGWGGNSSLFEFDRAKDEFNGISKNELLSARSAAEDDAGNLWIGTWGLGMSRYNPQTGEVKQFLDQDGLPSNYVKGILNDEHGNLWISTENGLSKFSIAGQKFRNYSVSDGLQANFFYTGSCLRGSDGKFYFGGPNGFNAFTPDSIREESYSVPVVVTEFRVFDRPQTFDRDVSLIDEIRLPHSEDMFSFEYASLDYSAPKRNQYAYRLEGYDKDWIQAGNRRYASYTHLDPDEYLFTVKGTNSDGVWSSQTASIRLIIAPAFWQTWWFRGGIVLLLGTSLYAVYRYRLRRLLEIERTRSFIATDLHDDIGASLTSIALSSDLARREVSDASPAAAKRLEKIAETSRSLLDSMNDIVWSIKPENDALEQTILRMEDYAVEMLEENGIDLHVEIPEELKKMKLPMDVRRNLFLIFKEAIGNVLKHAGANHVDVRIAWNTAGRRASDLLLSITDNGTGFDPASHKQGNGLGNMSRRAGHLRGNVAIVSVPGQGTNIEIRFPIKSPI
jgi:two-component sensor histidine kinase/streptogramin lyase